MTKQYTTLHLFSGIGGGALGFKNAGFESIGNFDFDEGACRSLTYLTGESATPVDLQEMQPEQMRQLCGGRRPDVMFTSPPCKSFSGNLGEALAQTKKYRSMSTLAFRGIWLALTAWSEPPPLIVMENVPRIMTRGREWLDDVIELLQQHGYAVRETVHDCGELGGLAQRRRRFLLVARHKEQVPELLYTPPVKFLRGVGEVIGALPVPVPGADGGPMHRLPRLTAMNWARLALIPTGGDWRDLPERVGLTCQPRATAYGVADWDRNANTIVGAACHDNGEYSIADPRLEHEPRRQGHGIHGWDESAQTVVGAATTCKGFNIADPRSTCDRREGAIGITGWTEPSTTVIGFASLQNGPWQVGDPRGVEFSHMVDCIGGEFTIHGPSLDLDSRKSASPVPVIRSIDGTWHRPMTTLELAALQGFPTRVDGEWLKLDGNNNSMWRQWIGNAVPVQAAEAIARECIETLNAAAKSKFRLRSEPVWVGDNNAGFSIQ